MSAIRCLQPSCTGEIEDGYCNVCGMAAGAPTLEPSAGTGPASSGGLVAGVSGGAHLPASSRLGLVPLGSARSTARSRPTRRLGTGLASSRLGAGLTNVPSVPDVDPRAALMQPAVVAEEKRFCSACQGPVGRRRGGSEGRTSGFCPKCRAPFDFEPKLAPGTLLGGQYEVVGCLAHGGMGWIYLARDRNVNDRWVVLKGLLNTGDPDATRAAIAEKQFLAEVEHPLIVEIYNFVTAADGASYIVMEYVGGRSLNQLLKEQMTATSGRFVPIPVDQAIAFIIEILPAFSYLHGLGLLYCDFKPANIIQVGDGLKLIDLGGVRRADDDDSPLYGTVGFQAPEVAADGASVASDVYTVARTLAVLVFEFRGYQSSFVDSLPAQETVPLFAEHDSLYRWLAKGTALDPEDRFVSADEMRQQLLGVLREVTATDHAATRVLPSPLFEQPAIADDELGWDHLPRLRVDPHDANAAWLGTITADQPAERLAALAEAPSGSIAVLLEMSRVLLELQRFDEAEANANQILELDPWEWRAAWVHGLVALARGRHDAAVASFNSVYGQLPGELAPKLALARACELAQRHDVAERMYRVCVRTDAAYVAPAAFGLARLYVQTARRGDAMAALSLIPRTSRAFADAHRVRADVLVATTDRARAPEDLAAAVVSLESAGIAPAAFQERLIDVLRRGLEHVATAGPAAAVSIAGAPVTDAGLRSRLERAYRDAARLAEDSDTRVALVDAANEVRVRSIR